MRLGCRHKFLIPRSLTPRTGTARFAHTAKMGLREPPSRHSDATGAIRFAFQASRLDLWAEVGRFPCGRLCRGRRLPAGIAQSGCVQDV